jgi:hypothetical protein
LKRETELEPATSSLGKSSKIVYPTSPSFLRRTRVHGVRAAGIRTRIGSLTFRATGITAYLKNKGTLEVAQHLANHESPRTMKLYDRRQDEISLDEVEKIAI